MALNLPKHLRGEVRTLSNMVICIRISQRIGSQYSLCQCSHESLSVLAVGELEDSTEIPIRE
jgi:hypothetical protein